MHHVFNCPVCNATNFNKFITCKDFTVSQEVFTIVECKDCRYKFTNPRPEPKNIGNYYKSTDYISHSDTKKGIVSKLYHIVRNYTLKNKLKLINKHVSRGTILDYGCGTGSFLSVCKNNGWNAFGFEPDNDAVKIANQKGVIVFNKLNELKNQNLTTGYDVITLWHVLEHVTELNETVSFLKENLKKDGALIIALPNYKSYDAEIYKEFWAAYDVPRHLYHFDQLSINDLMSKRGFFLEEIKPMPFDSFYVSLLSEKYRNNKNNYFRAFFNGFLSNIKAKKTNNYSSLIYIFKHK
jgi:SAM-dependent methyltransferase